jgi:hypothetical protein
MAFGILSFVPLYYGAFTLDVKSVLNENVDDILGGTQR